MKTLFQTQALWDRLAPYSPPLFFQNYLEKIVWYPSAIIPGLILGRRSRSCGLNSKKEIEIRRKSSNLTGGYIATNISLHSRRKRFKPKIPLPKKMRKFISQEFKSTKNIQRNFYIVFSHIPFYKHKFLDP
jgi:hypothetical protein